MSIDISIVLVIVIVILSIYAFRYRGPRRRPRGRPRVRKLNAVNVEQVAPVRPVNWEALTVRQRAIALRVAAGESDKDIAIALGITPGTVGTHMKEIFRRMNVRSRMQLVARMREMGKV